MADTVVVTGVPGVGASRVCEEARRELGDEFTLVNFGDVMLEEALEHGLAESRDALAELPVGDQRLLQRRAGEYVARKAEAGPLLVNTHLVIHSAAGYIHGFPDVVLSDVDPSVFVVVDAPAEAIAERRGSSERAYGSDPRSEIAFHRQLQTAATLAASTGTGAPIRHVTNDEGVGTAAGELADIAEQTVRR